MKQAEIIQKLKELKEKEKKRKFSQTVDLIVTLKDLNLKKPEDQVEFFGSLPHKTGKKVRVCALVGPELADKAKEACDTVVKQQDFAKYKDKKSIKQLANKHDYFIAQADIMTKVAASFGRVLGPKGKMPNPKAGCILPPKAAVKPLVERLRNTVKVSAKKHPMIQTIIGKEDMKEEEIAENLLSIYDQIIHHLPKERHNVKNVLIKLTMGKPVKIE
jgi:large subunit ribosomal protein L1